MEKITSINDLVQACYQNSAAHGFHDTPLNIGEKLMLITSELSEALEADRKDNHYTGRTDMDFAPAVFEQYIKDTFQDELADAAIRLFDLAGRLGIDLEWHIKQKMTYNASRPHKHGKKY